MAMTLMPATQPFRDAGALLDTPRALREQAQNEGYLFLRRLLDPQKLWSLQGQILDLCGQQGWLDERAPLMEGKARKNVCVVEAGKDPAWRHFYGEVQKRRAFHALARDPALNGVLEKIFGESVLPHSRNICRAIFPASTAFTTPPHQDHVHIGGTRETWTAWIPLGDCPLRLGGLAILPGSHREGLLPTHPAHGAGGRAVDVPAEGVWVEEDMRCGDVLLFHSLTVHQGRDNRSGDRIRLSVDFRYQPLSHPVRPDSMRPHYGFLDWEEIYAHWPKPDPLRYYWKDWDLRWAAKNA